MVIQLGLLSFINTQNEKITMVEFEIIEETRWILFNKIES